ncbi:MAG: AsmA family protein [Gammaproteobacteria bacterium]
MTFRRIVIGIAIVIVVLVGAALLYLTFGDFSRFRPHIETALTESLGREVRLGGEFDLRPLPTPSVSLTDLSIANADWGSAPAFLTLGRAEVVVDLWSLLFGPIEVRELRIEDVGIVLETDAEGRSNLPVPPDEEEEPEPDEDAGGLPLIIESGLVRNVDLTLRRADAEDRHVRVAELEIGQAENGDLRLEGSGELFGLPLGLTGSAGPYAALSSGGAVTNEFSGNIGELRFQVSGRSEAPLALDGSRFEATASSPAVEQLLRAFEVDMPLEGPLELAATVTSDAGVAGISGSLGVAGLEAQLESSSSGNRMRFDASLATLDRLGKILEVEGLPAQTLEAEGTLVFDDGVLRMEGVTASAGSAEASFDGSLREAPGASDVKLRLHGPSLTELSPDLPQLAFDFRSAIDFSTESVELTSLDLKFGDSDVAGTATVAFGEPLRVQARLESDRLDLTPFGSDTETPDAGAEASAENAEADSDGESPYVFGEDPLPLEALERYEADIDVGIAQLIDEPQAVKDVKVRLTLKDGDLNLTANLIGQHAGQAASHLRLTTDGQRAELRATAGLTFRMAASGASPRELAASVDGTALLTQGPGRLDNTLMSTLSVDLIAQLFSALNPFAEKEPYSTLECTVMSMEFDDGEGEIDGFLVQTEKLTIVGGGTVDLNTERLNIEFNTKPRSGVGISADMFVTPFVSLSGTLADPGVGLNPKGILLSGGAAFATGGLSFLLEGLADRVTAQADHCEKSLSEAGGHPSLEELLAEP